ncbi:MAG: rhomboid family intramembrane serine protease [Thermofilum sp. ex4484_79]|nr:MAG: rhomboid family intramembrane serine protease [Thermofilum sp. ex4484_79]
MFPLYDENRPLTKPIVNYVLIISNTIVFFYFYLQGELYFNESVVKYGMIPLYVLSGKRLYTIITSMFMHGGLLHLFGNMLYLYIFGDNVEDALGHLRYLIFYVLGGIGASLIHILSILLMPEDLMIYSLRIPSVGASGAISAVLGAYMLLYPYARIRTLVFSWWVTIISVPAYYYIGFWFVYQLVMGIMALQLPMGVAFWAHIGGFVTGIIFIKSFNIRPRPRRRIIMPFYIPIE